MFTDVATIEIRAGKGGDGRLGFRHEKYRAMGGPDGGDGGRGGDVVFKVDHNTNTLSHYRTTRKMVAQDGEAGGGNRMHGANGEQVIIKVPQGTQVWQDEELIADLTEPDQEQILAKGGRGGFGNAHFKSSTRQAPRNAELGEPGDALTVKLELKLVADVGLVGLPNAGKSTLLSVISNAKPEIADYPFTTLVPNLGVVDVDDYTFLVSDIPGLIEGASQGKGLGDEFLRHVTRTAVLLHLIDAASEDPARDYQVIQGELKDYGHELDAKPQLLVITKSETVLPEQLEATQAALAAVAGDTPRFVISAQAHQGLLELLRAAQVLVQTARAERAARAAEAAIPVIDTSSLPDVWSVEPEEDGVYRIHGDKIEGFARRTNFEQDDAVSRLRDIIRKTGIARELKRQGAKAGDTLKIGATEFAWLN